jgi:hypothetical protein
MPTRNASLVSADGRSAAFGEEAFANLAISLSGRFVRAVRVEEQQSLTIVFTDGAEISMSLRPEDDQGPEAVDFQGRHHQWAVI